MGLWSGLHSPGTQRPHGPGGAPPAAFTSGKTSRLHIRGRYILLKSQIPLPSVGAAPAGASLTAQGTSQALTTAEGSPVFIVVREGEGRPVSVTGGMGRVFVYL